MLLLLIVSLLGQAGEVGVHWETPEPGASTWVQAIWTWGEYRLTVHGEGGLLPWGFRRGGVRLSWDSPRFSLSPEATLFGTGRVDLFLSGLGKWNMSFQELSLSVQAGAKTGWAAVNLAPTRILATWVLARLERGGFFLEFSGDGPSPWQLRFRGGVGPISLNLGPTISLVITGQGENQNVSSQLQFGPTVFQAHSFRWTDQVRELGVSLDTSGRAWIQASSTQGDWTVSAFCLFSHAHPRQMVLEVRQKF